MLDSDIVTALLWCDMQYTSRAAELYKQQLEKDVAKFDTASYLATLRGKPAEPASVTAAITAADSEAVNGNGSSRHSSQNGSASNLAALDASSVDSAPASSTAGVTSSQGSGQLLVLNLLLLLHLVHVCQH